jgi:hypothetical protein
LFCSLKEIILPLEAIPSARGEKLTPKSFMERSNLTISYFVFKIVSKASAECSPNP